MDVRDGEVVLPVQNGQRLGARVGELLFHDERGGDLVALVEVGIHDEAVHLRAQRDRLEQGGHDEMEHRIGEVLLRLVLPGEIFVHGRQVDAQRDIRLVVAAVGVDDAGDIVQRVQLTQQDSVAAVAAAAFVLIHSHNLLVVYTRLRREVWH